MKQTIFEISFECGNNVGGIHTVITSKSEEMKKRFGRNYTTIGFFNPEQSPKEISQKTPPKYLKDVFSKLKKYNIDCIYGKWEEASDVPIILLDVRNAKFDVNDLKFKYWDWYEIDSLNANNDFDEPLLWGYCVGKLLKEIHKKRKNIICHFHEWLSGPALLYLKKMKLKIPTVFTTHATVLGRTLSSYKNVPEMVNKIKEKPIKDDVAYENKIESKHLLEKKTAINADVLTTVSKTTAEEVSAFFGLKPDVITCNAIDKSEIPNKSKLKKENKSYRKRIDDFLLAYFSPHYPLNIKDYPIFYTAGRYEFLNKGYDLFIDALGKLDKKLSKTDKTVVAFIFVPAGTTGIKQDAIDKIKVYSEIKKILKPNWKEISKKLQKKSTLGKIIEEYSSSKQLTNLQDKINKIKRMNKSSPSLCPFEFKMKNSEENDEILNALKENNLLNKKENKVKVIFYPIYLNREDGLLGLDYKEALTAGTMGAFLSRYEPWGYTPMEAAAYNSMAVTTDYAGFGRFVLKNEDNKNGIFVVRLMNESKKKAVEDIANIFENVVNAPKSKRLKKEQEPLNTIKKYNWEKQIKNYIKAYSLASKK